MTNKTGEQLSNFEDKWVALSEPDEEIVGSGRDIIEARKDAQRQGYTGDITFLKVFRFGQYIPASNGLPLPKSQTSR
jgi:hypothetical protein